MIFDRNRVIDSLCYDLEQWIGWKGYASDNLKLLDVARNSQKNTLG